MKEEDGDREGIMKKVLHRELYSFVVSTQQQLRVPLTGVFKGTIHRMAVNKESVYEKEIQEDFQRYPGLQGYVQKLLGDNDNKFFILSEDRNIFPIEGALPLYELISISGQLQADVLLGCAIGIEAPVRVYRNLFWLESFSHSKLLVVFRRFYDDFLKHLAAHPNSSLDTLVNKAHNKLLVYPFILPKNDKHSIACSDEEETPSQYSSEYITEMKRLMIIDRISDKFHYRQ